MRNWVWSPELERGAGEGAAFPDDLYSGVTFCADLSELSERAQIMLSGAATGSDEIKLLHSLGRLWWAAGCILAVS